MSGTEYRKLVLEVVLIGLYGNWYIGIYDKLSTSINDYTLLSFQFLMYILGLCFIIFYFMYRGKGYRLNKSINELILASLVQIFTFLTMLSEAFRVHERFYYIWLYCGIGIILWTMIYHYDNLEEKKPKLNIRRRIRNRK